jgi:hypothetical protein
VIAAALGRNLLAEARLAFFLRVRAFDFRVSAVDYAVLLAFNAVLWILAAGLRVGFAGEIDYSALLVYLATVPLVLAASLLVALVYGAQERLLAWPSRSPPRTRCSSSRAWCCRTSPRRCARYWVALLQLRPCPARLDLRRRRCAPSR